MIAARRARPGRASAAAAAGDQRPQPAGRVQRAAGQRTGDHDREAEGSADRERRPVLRRAGPKRDRKHREYQDQRPDPLDDEAGEVAAERELTEGAP